MNLSTKVGAGGVGQVLDSFVLVYYQEEAPALGHLHQPLPVY